MAARESGRAGLAHMGLNDGEKVPSYVEKVNSSLL